MVTRVFFSVLFSMGACFATAQTLEFRAVLKLPATVNTTAEEGMPLLSPDGKQLFFTRSLYINNEGGVYAGQDVWVSERGGNGWKAATNTMASINNKHNNVVSGISKDGKTLYFVNASPFQRMNGIYFTRQLNSLWTRPELIAIPGIDNLDFIGFYVSPDMDVIFLSMKAPDSRGNEDLYFSVKDVAGAWSRPRSLGPTINTAGFEISPFLSADKKRLYFSSNGHKGEGDADIFYSERLYDSWETWSVPVNLGSVVNSKKFDAYFSIYGDSVAYFSSNREGQYADLYQASTSYGKTILAKGQHYITPDEWSALVGRNVAAEFTFSNKSFLLTSAQKELIFYIVNKLMLQRDIRFHLVIKEEEDRNASAERIKIIQQHLRQAGIDPARISGERIFDVTASRRGVIEMRLFR